MCGRYSLSGKTEFEFNIAGVVVRLVGFALRYNVAPTQLMPVIVQEQKPTVKEMRWGMVPAWAKDEKTGFTMINAKVENLVSSNHWRRVLKSRRCLVPADGFYEWQSVNGRKRPWRFVMKNEEPFLFAGLWDRWVRPATPDDPPLDLDDEPPPSRVVDSFTIITVPANELVAKVHDRMPTIISPAFYQDWLDSSKGREQNLVGHLEPFPAAYMEAYPVSPVVNNARVDSPECLKRIGI
jgi:putative SOS response-associated peptidase YedK